MFGLPAAQASGPIAPSPPWVGALTMLNVRSQVSTSVPARVTVSGVSWAVLRLRSAAVGMLLAGGLTVIVTVAAVEKSVPSETRYVKLSGPL